MGKINIRGVNFDNVTMAEALELGKSFLESEGVKAVYTPNSEIVQLCIDKPEFFDIINSADMIIPDGIGVIKASRVLGTPLKEKVAGVDFGANILAYAAEEGIPVYLLGGKPGVAETAKEKLGEKHPALNIVGLHDGYFKKEGEESDSVIGKINESGAKILFVCLGVPAQETWIYNNREKLKSVRLALGLGGSLDVYAGNVKRAPKIFIKLGLEWFYRLLKQPSRIGRMMQLPRFMLGTYKDKRKMSKKG